MEDNNNEKHTKRMKQLFNSDLGKQVLARLKSDYVDSSAYSENPHTCFYRLGRKEFIQDLIRYVDNPKEIDQKIIDDF